MDTWGDLKAYKITDPADFWPIIDNLFAELSETASETGELRGFYCNRRYILEAFMRGDMYGLKVVETDEMYENTEALNPIFCRDSFGNLSGLYVLPCFCITEGSSATMIWVHSRARRRGFGKALVEQLSIETADTPLPDSIPFWEACGIQY